MSRIAVDFGTSGTVVAVAREGRPPATLGIPGVTSSLEGAEVAPSLIHHSEEATWIGAQVVERGLLEHPATFRWMKRAIALGSTKRKRTPRGPRSAAEAGADLLELLLRYHGEAVDLAGDEVTFTAPVEAFEPYREWLEGICDRLGIARRRFLDESTATVLAHRDEVRAGERFLIFDFGCGTLDVSVVRIDPLAAGGRQAVQLGKAGLDLGGMDIDRWIVDDYAARAGLDARGRRALEPSLLLAAEEVKIALSRRPDGEAVLAARTEGGAAPGPVAYRASCPGCAGGLGAARPAPGSGQGERSGAPCLGCILLARGLARRTRETIDRALENAAIKAGLRRAEITAALVTGGTSLLPAVRALLLDLFGERTRWERPFDAVALGACRGLVAPILQHDYAIESYSAARGEYEFQPLLSQGTEYPTTAAAARLWAKGTHDGMTRIGLRIFEVSQVARRGLEHALVDAEGALVDQSRVPTDRLHVCLNRERPTFIAADPPIAIARDARRFLCTFRVDAERRLLVTVDDRLAQRRLLEDHPVVRL